MPRKVHWDIKIQILVWMNQASDVMLSFENGICVHPEQRDRCSGALLYPLNAVCDGIDWLESLEPRQNRYGRGTGLRAQRADKLIEHTIEGE